MARDYVERRDGGYYILGSRVRLDVVIHEYMNGAPAESIALSFPTLSLEQIHGALAFYHGNRAEVDQSLADKDREWEEFRAKHPIPATLKARLERAKQHIGERG
ncbi:MAG TPA: DUF433 domain-containing protein [Bryobacteraceae bacterium]|jgi:uncharacterized protein (DUF433 family)|nr:DUF433 domain-containing protein [Bryobacteraceae bacterium]